MRSFAALIAGVAFASAQSLTTTSVPTGPPMGVYQTVVSIPALTATTVVPVSTSSVVKRDASTTASTCLAQPTGISHTSSPDDAATFLADTYYSSAALSVSTPSGYTAVFINTTASPNADSYMGFTLMTGYDVASCAAQCSSISGCNSFNVYFERDPSVNPDDSSCLNPSSVTNVKCVWWGSYISTSVNVNAGQWRGNFHVVIAGSNGYTKNAVASTALTATTLATIKIAAVATSTVSATSSTATASATSTAFLIQVGYSGTTVDNKYIAVSSAGVVSYVAKASASKFTIDSAGDLVEATTGYAAITANNSGTWQKVSFGSLSTKTSVFSSCYLNAQYVSCNINSAFQFAGVCNNDGALYFGLPRKIPSGCSWLGLYPTST